jgi:hypothetical protein
MDSSWLLINHPRISNEWLRLYIRVFQIDFCRENFPGLIGANSVCAEGLRSLRLEKISSSTLIAKLQLEKNDFSFMVMLRKRLAIFCENIFTAKVQSYIESKVIEYKFSGERFLLVPCTAFGLAQSCNLKNWLIIK